MEIIKVNIKHLEDLIPLFNGYRIFYRQTPNIEAARSFLKDRITKNDSVIFLAYINDIPVGFTQLYSLFSSVSMQPMYLLNDLFIHQEYRNRGIGNALIDKAKSLCKEKNYKGLAIQTEVTNKAQYLYERLGFVKDPDLQFFWTNN